MHKLYSMYNEARLSFGNWYMCLCVMQKYTPHLFCSAFKCCLEHISVNSQNNRFSTEIGEVSLDGVKVGVWYASSGTRVIGSVFFFLPKTINSHQYVTFWYCLGTPVWLQKNLCLFPARQCNSWHHKWLFTVLRVFGDRILNRGFWSPHLPAIKLSYFYANNSVSDGDVKKRCLECCVNGISSRNLM